MDYSFAYFIGCLVLAPLWALLYETRPQLRKPMLLMSLLVAPLGLITLSFFTYDYWTPQYLLGPWLPLEELVFSFLIAGIGGAAYEATFGVRTSREPVAHKRWWAFVLFCIGMAGMWAGFLAAMLSVHISTILLICFAITLSLATRRIMPSLYAAVVCVACMTLVYGVLTLSYGDISLLWIPHGILGPTFFGGVPLEELLWAFAWGACAAPAFEFVAASRYSR